MARRKIEKSTIVAIDKKLHELIEVLSAQEIVDYMMDNIPIKKLEELLEPKNG